MGYMAYIGKDEFTLKLSELEKIVKSKAVLFYGAGLFFDYAVKNYGLNNFRAVGVSDRKFKDNELGMKYLNYNVIPVNYIDEYDIDYIIITAQESERIIAGLRKIIANREIEILSMFDWYNEKYKSLNYVTDVLKEKNFDILKYDANKQEVVFSNKTLNILTDVTYPWIVAEVFGSDIYKLKSKIDTTKKYNVLDIGANRCYASLYFAQKDWVKDVYAFELVPQTIEIAKKNIQLNPKYSNKIHLYPFGLGKNNANTIIERLPHRDGCNTIIPDFFNNYMPEEHQRGVQQLCTLKKASEALRKIVEENMLDNIIFKIDVEGAEYDILEDLKDNYSQIFDKIEIIIGDSHLDLKDFIIFCHKISSKFYMQISKKTVVAHLSL